MLDPKLLRENPQAVKEATRVKRVGSPEMVDMLCTDDVKKQLLRAGGGFTRIYAPDGSPMGKVIPEDQEGIVYADIDLGMISLAKAAADPSGHYARPDVTRLLLNRAPGDHVVMAPMPAAEAAEEAAPAVPQEAVVPIGQAKGAKAA